MAREPVTVVHLQRQSKVAERLRSPTAVTGHKIGETRHLVLRRTSYSLSLIQSLCTDSVEGNVATCFAPLHLSSSVAVAKR